MAIIDVVVTRFRVRMCRCGFWCDVGDDDEWPEGWEDHLLKHPEALPVFRWRGAIETTLS